MEERNELIAKLQKCLPLLHEKERIETEINLRFMNICDNNDKIKKYESKSSLLPQAIIIFIALLTICFPFTIIPFSVISDIFGLLAGIFFAFILMPSIYMIITYTICKHTYRTRKAEVITFQKLNENLDSEIDELYNSLTKILESELGMYALEIIPKDYFYVQAVEKFIFFISNGHADSMKEALKEFDNYIHNAKMEEFAEQQYVLAEKTAKASAEAARAAKNAEFWSLYNAYLSEKRYRS